MSFDEASKICTDIEHRLCTKQELKDKICCGSGGSCDSEIVWTSTPENPEPGKQNQFMKPYQKKFQKKRE